MYIVNSIGLTESLVPLRPKILVKHKGHFRLIRTQNSDLKNQFKCNSHAL